MTADPLSLTFAALAHPARRAILARLSEGSTSVQDLAQPLAISGPAVTRHLKTLERGGLIRRSRNAQWRPCRIELAPILRAEKWMDELRRETEGRLDRLEAYLKEIQTEAGPKPERKDGDEP